MPEAQIFKPMSSSCCPQGERVLITCNYPCCCLCPSIISSQRPYIKTLAQNILFLFSCFFGKYFEVAVIKSAASAVSPEGFASRKAELSSCDQVSCWRSLPEDGGGRLGSPGFLHFGLRGVCASSRLDHGSKTQLYFPAFFSSIFGRVTKKGRE